MIDNFWILVTQLCSVLVYIGTAFWLYKLLAAQKDATIEAKDATIENLQIQLQQAESKIPDTLVTLLKDRLTASREELGRLKQDKDKSLSEIQTLKERQEITSNTVAGLLWAIKVFQFLSKPTNEDYNEFVITICGDIDKAVRTICTSGNLSDLISKHGKTINEVNHADLIGIPREKLVVARYSKLYSYAILKDNTIMIDDVTLRELTGKHKEIQEYLN